jgi:DNA-binding MarR family transcriptional regulator
MSGMKFRLQCAGCGSVFFAPDRKARYCPKCIKKHPVKSAPEQAQTGFRPAASPARVASKPTRPVGAAVKARKGPEIKPPKAGDLTPELRERIEQIYRDEYAGKEVLRVEMVKQISDKVWLKRSIVSAMIHRIQQPEVELTPELKARVIELYEGYVRKGERPADGRRKTISNTLDIPYHQVKDLVYQWSLSQYELSPAHDLSREQKFAMEKVYWDELRKERYRLDEMPERIAEQVGYATSYQVARWLDMLYDDDRKFEKVEDLPEEIVRRIREGYLQYLEAPKPPDLGLHTTLAQQIGGITARQVHKVLHRFRKEMRAAYPLQ